MSKTHIMLDLETMGNSSSAAITAIGAAKFSVEDGIIDTFYEKVDLESAAENGGVIDASTVVWWLKQGDEARKEMTQPGTHINLALDRFSYWVDLSDPCVWGNGAAFDNVILTNAYKAADRTPPWKHWNDRCYRTIKAMFKQTPMVEPPEIAHHAMYDAIAQAKHLILIAKTHGLELQ